MASRWVRCCWCKVAKKLNCAFHCANTNVNYFLVSIDNFGSKAYMVMAGWVGCCWCKVAKKLNCTFHCANTNVNTIESRLCLPEKFCPSSNDDTKDKLNE